MSMTRFEPRDARDLSEIISKAVEDGSRLAIVGGGSKADFGAPAECTKVCLGGLSGIVDYDPAELVLTVLAGTPLAEVEALVAAEGQMLAFEPFDHGPVYGQPSGASTIGGVMAASVAGSRRVTAGGARDHLLGFTAISGRGTLFVGGAKVVKNVTGYDLPKLMAGSWGRLAAFTELTIKVLPKPRQTVTLVAEGLDPSTAHVAMARALGSNANISAAAHLSSGSTIFRIEGFEPSVAARCNALPSLLRDMCELHPLDEQSADLFWKQASTGSGLAGSILWRVHLPARKAPDLITRLGEWDIDWAMDWGGGLVWVALDDCACPLRDMAASLGGEATLVRGPVSMRADIPAFHPRTSGVMALEKRVRAAFDPAGVFATGRFDGDGHAD